MKVNFSLEIKRATLERQNLKCAYCGRTITLSAYRLRDWKKILGHYPDLTVPSQAKFHHKIWRSRGGLGTLENCVALCGLCHTHKAHRPFKEVLAE